MSAKTGKITQVIGPVIDVAFSKGSGELPNIFDALEVVNQKGIKQGLWKEYYLESGKLKAEGEYLDGNKIKDWNFYFESGKIEQRGKYNKDGFVHGLWKWYYSSGTILREEEFIRGRENGLINEYSSSGLLTTEGQYLDGYEEGNWKILSGDFREEGKFIGGLKQGIWKGTFKNGKTHRSGRTV